MSSSGGGGVSRLEQAATNTTKSKSPMGNKRFMVAKVAFFFGDANKKADRCVERPNTIMRFPCGEWSERSN